MIVQHMAGPCPSRGTAVHSNDQCAIVIFRHEVFCSGGALTSESNNVLNF